MKKQLLLLCFAALAASAHCQSLSPTVIASSGGFSTQPTFSLSYTVGELAAVQTFIASNNILTQGFQQPNGTKFNGVTEVKAGDGSLHVYPVPASDILWYSYEFSGPGKVEVEVLNILGMKLDYKMNEDYTSGILTHSFDCTGYASGSYIMNLKYTSASGQVKMMSRKIQVITD